MPTYDQLFFGTGGQLGGNLNIAPEVIPFPGADNVPPSTSMMIGPDGQPWVSILQWTDDMSPYGNQGPYVQRWNGSSWVLLPGPEAYGALAPPYFSGTNTTLFPIYGGSGPIYNPYLAHDGSAVYVLTGTRNLASQPSTQEIFEWHVWKWDGGWTQLGAGQTGATPSAASYGFMHNNINGNGLKLVANASDPGHPWVLEVSQEISDDNTTNKIWVWRWNGSSWTRPGAQPIDSARWYFTIDLAINDVGNVSAFAIDDFNTGGVLQPLIGWGYAGGGWAKYTAGISMWGITQAPGDAWTGQGGASPRAIASGAHYFAAGGIFAPATSYSLYLSEFNPATGWRLFEGSTNHASFNPGPFGTGFFSGLAVGWKYQEQPWVLWTNSDIGDRRNYIVAYTNCDWQLVGALAEGAWNNKTYVSVVFDASYVYIGGMTGGNTGSTTGAKHEVWRRPVCLLCGSCTSPGAHIQKQLHF